MAEMRYLDFALLIERTGEGYIARVLASPTGEASVDFKWDMPRQELLEVEAVKAFGRRLFETVFAGTVRSCLDRSLDEANRQDAGLRIRLRLSDVPELAGLPWEYLYDPVHNKFLCLSSESPLVRYLELPERIQPLTVKLPLKVLVMTSSPNDYEPLDLDQEWERLHAALGDLKQRGLVTLKRVDKATPEALQRQLRQGEYNVFHFIGHGGFDERVQGGVLILEDEQQQGKPITGQELGSLLGDHRPLRLVILNACEGARASHVDPFGGTAQSLVQQRVPAVIAMQFEIADEAAIILARDFYGALADGYPVDAALTEARKAIFTSGNDVEWGTPVLYLRAPDGHIFDVKRLSEEEQKQTQLATLSREAEAAMAKEDWASAVEKFQRLLEIEPSRMEATALLDQARQKQKLLTLFTKGQEHYDAGRWRQALDYFEQVRGIGGNYQGVYAFIATAQHEIEKDAATPAASNSTSSSAGRSSDPLDAHYKTVIKAILDGSVVPFLGPDVNLCGRPPGIAWQYGQYLPSGGELSAYLAENFDYPSSDAHDLLRVSQYIAVKPGSPELYEALRKFLNADYPPTLLHQFLATLPAVLRDKGYHPRYQLIVTSNYDDVLERTFHGFDEPFDLVSYVANGELRGKFLHWSPDGAVRPIEKPNEYRGLSLDQRTIILKIHGAVDRSNTERDSYVITEDDFIGYLTHTDISNLVPVTLAAKLRNSRILFMGHGWRDWNLRVFLHRIWGERAFTYRSWAIQLDPQPIDQEFWHKHNVDILPVRLEDYVAALSERLQTLPHSGGGL